jgi:hypothetical protein
MKDYLKEELLSAWKSYTKDSESEHPCEHFKAGFEAGSEQCSEDLRCYITLLTDLLNESEFELQDLLDYLYKGGIPFVQRTEYGKRAYLIS